MYGCQLDLSSLISSVKLAGPEYPGMWSKVILDVSVRVLLDEIDISIDGL